mgnify:CR=1 FL=1
MWLLPIQKNEAIIYKTYNINSLSYTLLPLMAKRGTLSSVITLCYLYFQLNQNGILEA